MFVRKSTDNSTPILHRLVVEKHGSHNQKSHGKGGGKGGGGGSSSGGGDSGSSISVPENMSGDKKMDEAISALPKETRDAAYRGGFEMGAKARKDALANTPTGNKTLDSLWNRSSNWIKDTKSAINQDGATMGEGWMVETVRAIGVVNGILKP